MTQSAHAVPASLPKIAALVLLAASAGGLILTFLHPDSPPSAAAVPEYLARSVPVHYALGAKVLALVLSGAIAGNALSAQRNRIAGAGMLLVAVGLVFCEGLHSAFEALVLPALAALGPASAFRAAETVYRNAAWGVVQTAGIVSLLCGLLSIVFLRETSRIAVAIRVLAGLSVILGLATLTIDQDLYDYFSVAQYASLAGLAVFMLGPARESRPIRALETPG